MNRNYLTSYQPLEGSQSLQDDDLSPEYPRCIDVPNSGKKRWNHIDDLDSFFIKIYQYFIGGGFKCMMIERLFELIQFIFTVSLSTFVLTGINYQILFKYGPVNDKDPYEKRTIPDCVNSWEEISHNFNWLVISLLIMASAFWFLKLGQFLRDYVRFKEMKSFYQSGLNINEVEIHNITWSEVLQRVIDVQIEQRMCIHKENLTELDITHRILRFPNYFIAMVNKNLLPLNLQVPFLGNIVFLTRGLRYNLNLILFNGLLAPFKNNWHLRDEYKRYDKRKELAEQLRKKFLILAFINLIFSPFILLWQILNVFYTYVEIMKRDPSLLGTRRWSHYGEVYLRHFNELDHELQARLNRGYRPASSYMNIFTAKLTTIFMRFASYISGAICGVIIVLTIIDEDVLQVEHLLLIASITGVTAIATRSVIPNENMVFCPELLLTRAITEIHYAGDHWKGKAHTFQVRDEFSQMFQYKVTHIMEELLSPLLTPYILFKLSNQSLAIVNFFRSFTIEVPGVGDVCSFAQMDVGRHGSRTWFPDSSDFQNSFEDGATRTTGGKTELSLLNFTLTKPKWRPPEQSKTFLDALKAQAQRDYNTLATVNEENALSTSMGSYTSSVDYGGLGASAITSPFLQNRNLSPLRGRQSYFQETNHGILSSLSASVAPQSGLYTDEYYSPMSSLMPQPSAAQPQDFLAIDVGVSTLYLRELHQRRLALAQFVDNPSVRVQTEHLPQDDIEQGGTPVEEISNFAPSTSHDDNDALPSIQYELSPLISNT